MYWHADEVELVAGVAYAGVHSGEQLGQSQHSQVVNRAAVHTRSEHMVGAVIWYGVAPPHVVTVLLQLRSDVRSVEIDGHVLVHVAVAVQLVKFAHAPNVFGAAAVVRYCRVQSQLWALLYATAPLADRHVPAMALSAWHQNSEVGSEHSAVNALHGDAEFC